MAEFNFYSVEFELASDPTMVLSISRPVRFELVAIAAGEARNKLISLAVDQV